MHLTVLKYNIFFFISLNSICTNWFIKIFKLKYLDIEILPLAIKKFCNDEDTLIWIIIAY